MLCRIPAAPESAALVPGTAFVLVELLGEAKIGVVDVSVTLLNQSLVGVRPVNDVGRQTVVPVPAVSPGVDSED